MPSGWIFSSSGIDVFEFSTDLAVKVGLKKLESKPDFLHDIMRVVTDFDSACRNFGSGNHVRLTHYK